MVCEKRLLIIVLYKPFGKIIHFQAVIFILILLKTQNTLSWSDQSTKIIPKEALEQLNKKGFATFYIKSQKVIIEIFGTKIQSVNNSTPTTELLTRKEASKLLGVSLPTLLDWTNTGKIIGYRIASRVRYKRSELENSLAQIRHK